MWRALETVLSDIEHKVYAFQFPEALWCHQEEGLQHAYINDERTHKFIRKVIALSYVPAQHISHI